MRKSKVLLVICLLGICFFCGCQRGQKIQVVDNIRIDGLESGEIMEKSRQVLSKMNFVVDKYSPEELYIRTRPLAGGQFFEFWRKDNVGSFNKLESNLNSIRRTVELKFTQEAGGYSCACKVLVERLSLSEEADSSSAVTYDRFNENRIGVSPGELELESANQQWINLGNDEKLASLILSKIKQQFYK